MLRRHYRALTSVTAVVLAALVAIVASGPVITDGLLLDLLITARAFSSSPTTEDAPVAVVALDQRSLFDSQELTAYPRALMAPVWADVLNGLFAAKARTVGFDLIFAYSANQFSPGFDTPFLAALGQHRDHVVLARSAKTLPASPFMAALRNDPAAVGLTELVPDPDRVYRHVHATLPTVDGEPVPTLASAVLRRANGPAFPPEVLLTPRRNLETIPTYSMIDVLRCSKHAPEALGRVFASMIILIGTTLPDEDRKASSGRFLTPVREDSGILHPCGLRRLAASAPESDTVPGVFLQAAAIAAVLDGHVTSTAPPGVVALLAAGTAAVGVVVGLTLQPWLSAAVVVGLGLLLFGAGTLALARDVWIPLALPLGALLAAPVLAYVVRYLVEERARRQIQHAFSHYVSPMIVDRLAVDPAALTLGGERREVTVMFSDLSGFTTTSGKVSPEALTQKTNQYLAYIVDQAEATGGYVDKFIGDAVMALWGAPANDPDHAVNAIRAALAAVARIRKEHDDAEARGEVGFSVKIGLNSGPAVIGNVGTERRYNYTAVGETVNVASRLESVPSLYACQIVVGPRTAELAKHAILFRELDTIQVKGRDAPLVVFEPLAEITRVVPEQQDRAQRYAAALAHYRAMRFADAYTIWDALAREESPHYQKDEPGSSPASRMAERARHFIAEPPPPDWEGVWVLTGK